MNRVITALLLALAFSAAPHLAAGQRPASGQAVPRRDAAVPFAVGETLNYDVTWSTYLVAGSATATVVEKRQASPASTAYHIVAEGRPIPLLSRLYNLYYKLDTLLDSFTLLPHRGSLYSEEGGEKRTAITQFDRRANRATFEVQADTTGKADFVIPPQAQDGLSTLYVLRAMTLKTGSSFTLPVSDSGAMYTAKLDVGGVERVKVPFGEREAWNIAITVSDQQGQPVTKNGAAWISTDGRRLPLKLQGELPVGYFVLMLRDAK